MLSKKATRVHPEDDDPRGYRLESDGSSSSGGGKPQGQADNERRTSVIMGVLEKFQWRKPGEITLRRNRSLSDSSSSRQSEGPGNSTTMGDGRPLVPAGLKRATSFDNAQQVGSSSPNVDPVDVTSICPTKMSIRCIRSVSGWDTRLRCEKTPMCDDSDE
jgi:hypothetical protein